jgi:hydrogenase large subunit
VRGSAAADCLAARAGFLRLMGYLAGKWPHTLTVQPGGSARAIEAAERLRIFALLKEFRGYLEHRMFGDALESVAALSSEAQIEAWTSRRAPGSSDFRMFLEIADALGLEGMGRATDQFISYGAYRVGGSALFAQGRWRSGDSLPLDPEAIAEDLSHSWMDGPSAPLAPANGLTRPAPDKNGAYSWCKAPRMGGEVAETGALARQVVSGHPLIRDLVQRHGGNVKNRVIARLLELALVVPKMEEWTRSLAPGEPFCRHGDMPQEARGVGMVEAARGSLGHWLGVSAGRIANYQIVAPTTWNFSPRDASGTPGAVEQALVGAPVRAGETTPVAVQHVVRSFDPCMVCTVH